LGELEDGPLATDRPHVLKAYGGYTFDWWKSSSNATEISFFTQAMSGTPQTTVIDFGVPLVATKRGDMGRTPTFTQTDLSLSHSYKFGRDGRFKVVGDLTLLNAFNENNITALDPRKFFHNYIGETEFVPEFADGSGYGVAGFQYTTQFMNAVLNGEAAPFIQALDTPLNRNQAFGQPSAFQGKRNIRFGFRFIF